MHRALGILVAFVVLGVGFGGWWLTRGPQADPAAVPSDASSAAPGSGEPADLRSGPAAVAADAPAAPALETPARRAVREDEVDGGSTRVRGRVLDGERPLAAFLVIVLEPVSGRAVVNAEVEDSPDGRFAVEVPAAGAWLVLAVAGRRSTQTEEVGVPQSEDELTLTLDPLADLRARVLDPLGAPVAGARVLYGPRNFVGEVSTDGLGRALASGLAPGVYRAVALAEGWAASEVREVAAGALGAHEEVVLTLRAAARIHGRVLDANGDPERDTEVKCHSRSEGGDGYIRSSVRTDADGHFEFTDLPPDLYMVGIEDDMDRREAPENPIRVELVELQEGQEVELLLSAARAEKIRVRGRLLAPGTPLEGASMVTLADGRRVLDDANEVGLDAAGNFTCVLSTAGPFVFMFEVGGSTFPFRVEVPPEGLDGLVVELPLGRVHGRVLAPDGEPVMYAEVVLERMDGHGLFEVGRRPLERRTIAEGEFVFEHVPAGSYALRARHDDWGLSPVVSGLELAAGAALGPVELELGAFGSVSVRVLDAESRPAHRASVFARRVGGPFVNVHGREVSPNDDAEFSLPVGRYTFLARSFEGASLESAALTVEDGGSHTVQLELGPGTRLSVSLVESDGTPVPGRLRVLDEGGRAHTGLVAGHDLEQLLMLGFSTLAPDVGPLPPGRYRVESTAPDGRWTESAVTLAGEARRELELRLP